VGGGRGTGLTLGMVFSYNNNNSLSLPVVSDWGHVIELQETKTVELSPNKSIYIQ